ncbi:MAG: hypothetical protein H6Q15_1431 [Bacteroidetes bacterium]|nr:hypothetical protein [Bacteroidota bacterium]
MTLFTLLIRTDFFIKQTRDEIVQLCLLNNLICLLNNLKLKTPFPELETPFPELEMASSDLGDGVFRNGYQITVFGLEIILVGQLILRLCFWLGHLQKTSLQEVVDLSLAYAELLGNKAHLIIVLLKEVLNDD